jgi:hypothetical protein
LENDSQIEGTVALVLVLAIVITLGFAYLGLCVALALRAAGSGSSEPSAAVPSSEASAVAMPFDWLVPSVCALVIAFAPFAFAAVVHAAKVGPLHRLGAIEAARESARRAKRWFWWSVAAGGTLLVGSFAPWLWVMIN